VSRITRFLRRLPFPPALALPVALIAMTAGLRPPSQAADAQLWSAGDRAAVGAPASDPIAGTARARAGAMERALGLEVAADRSVSVVADRFHGVIVDEITYRDGRSRPIGIVRLSEQGVLLSAVRLGYRESFAQGSLSRDAAISRAVALARELDVDLFGADPGARPTMNGAMWTITWPRTVGGLPVDGDGVTVRLWRSGDLHSVTVSERPLSPPTTTIGADRARASLDALLPDLVSGERRGDGSVGDGTLHWVAPNDRYRPSGADAPAPVLRLAYVFVMRFGGPSAALVRAVTFWIDAETGELIGGDALQ
jgi:hypothetical protein